MLFKDDQELPSLINCRCLFIILQASYALIEITLKNSMLQMYEGDDYSPYETVQISFYFILRWCKMLYEKVCICYLPRAIVVLYNASSIFLDVDFPYVSCQSLHHGERCKRTLLVSGTTTPSTLKHCGKKTTIILSTFNTYCIIRNHMPYINI